MLQRFSRSFAVLAVITLFPKSNIHAQDTIEALHREARLASRAGTDADLMRAVTLWTEALALCEQSGGCLQQLQMTRGVSTAYLGLAQLDSALVFSSEALRLQNSSLLQNAAVLVSQAPKTGFADSVGVITPEEQQFLVAANNLIKASLPTGATAGLLPDTPGEVRVALEALVSSGVAVPISIQSNPSGMNVRFRERPRPNVAPSAWNYVNTQYGDDDFRLFYLKEIQVCYGNGSSARMIIQNCGNGCQVIIPRDDATPSCTPN